MADSGPRSLYIVVLRDHTSPWFCSILQFNNHPPQPKNFVQNFNSKQPPIKQRLPSIKQPPIKQGMPSSSGNPLLQKEYIAHFRLLQRPASIAWKFSPLPCTQELCMVPYLVSTYKQINRHLPSFHAYTFNFGTNTCTKISPCTIPSKPKRCVVTLGGYMYFMPQPYDFRYSAERPSFERYNPARNSWETLNPFPHPDKEFLRNICGTAVLDDDSTIIFNMGDPDIWAYNVNNNSWYPVTVEDSLCYSFVGEAVVQENTIYAFKDRSYESLLALSISIVREESNGGDLVYITCSLLSESTLPDISPILLGEVAFSSKHLVRFGKDNLCLVRSCVHEGFHDYQHIEITYMKRCAGTSSLIVTDNKVHKLRLEDSKQFRVGFCFSMPDCKTPAPAVKHGNNIFFDIDPFRVGFDIDQICQKHGKIFFNSDTGHIVMPPRVISPLVAKDEDDVSSQTTMIDEQEFEQGGPSAEEEDVPEKSSESLVAAGSTALSKASTISSATDGNYPASPMFETVGEELEYYTRGMSRGEAFKARSMLLDRWRNEHCQEMSRSLAKNSPFPEA